ncbi:MAG: high-potential iron-sulfur protein [Sinobacteraceae bacterium]|nr:high-potential iron-sulfur protein [Nevskiaceae bacterium]
MTGSRSTDRRRFVTRSLAVAIVGSSAIFLSTRGRTAATPALRPDDPAAKALKYTEDARTVKDVPAGNTCGNCALYQGTAGSASGPCQLFAGKLVKAAGWCSSWSPQM